MHTEFRKAVVPDELRSLVLFDHKVFLRGDWFSETDWKHLHSYWLLADGVKIGCSAFERNVDFQQDQRPDGRDPFLIGSLYIASTGILPRYQRRGFGHLLKSWQICYARQHKFSRIVTNTRQRNSAMIRLNEKFGFRAIRTTPDYYSEPADATVVMELLLNEPFPAPSGQTEQ